MDPNPVVELAKSLGPDIAEVTVFLCPDCSQEYEDREEAERCCPRDVESETRFRCPQCEELHESSDDAFLCCDQPEQPGPKKL
jgi:predicted RNA-binding Zn-ribbon protein involved in translation (DUF1610 family)